MNDEIKDISVLQNYVNRYKSDEKAIINHSRLTTPLMLDYLEVKALLDYITNLQQELHQASLDIQELTERDIGCPSWCDKLTNLQQLEQEHKKINGELREENSKLTIALQNIQEDYDRRIEENERLKELNENASKVCMAEHRYGVDKAEEARDYKSRCEKASDKLSFIDEALENDTLNVPLCIVKINSALNILQKGSEKDDR